MSAVSVAILLRLFYCLMVLLLDLRDLLLRLIEGDATRRPEQCAACPRASSAPASSPVTSARMAFVAAVFRASGSFPLARTWFSIASSGFVSTMIGAAVCATVCPRPPTALVMPLKAPPTNPPTAVDKR